MTISNRLRRLHHIAIFTLTAVATILLVWIFTPATIIPPVNPAEPTTVYVVDRGLHSRLVLPTGNGKELIEYAYGDWNYFALNNQKLSDGLAALFLRTPGTLGRRKFSNFAQLLQLVKHNNFTLLSFDVAGAKAIQLLQNLEASFSRNINTRIENPLTRLTLVKYDQDYTLFHNSNHEVVAWLQELDCQVEGFVSWANFRVQH